MVLCRLLHTLCADSCSCAYKVSCTGRHRSLFAINLAYAISMHIESPELFCTSSSRDVMDTLQPHAPPKTRNRNQNWRPQRWRRPMRPAGYPSCRAQPHIQDLVREKKKKRGSALALKERPRNAQAARQSDLHHYDAATAHGISIVHGHAPTEMRPQV